MWRFGNVWYETCHANYMHSSNQQWDCRQSKMSVDEVSSMVEYFD